MRLAAACLLHPPRACCSLPCPHSRKPLAASRKAPAPSDLNLCLLAVYADNISSQNQDTQKTKAVRHAYLDMKSAQKYTKKSISQLQEQMKGSDYGPLNLSARLDGNGEGQFGMVLSSQNLKLRNFVNFFNNLFKEINSPEHMLYDSLQVFKQIFREKYSIFFSEKTERQQVRSNNNVLQKKKTHGLALSQPEHAQEIANSLSQQIEQDLKFYIDFSESLFCIIYMDLIKSSTDINPKYRQEQIRFLLTRNLFHQKNIYF